MLLIALYQGGAQSLTRVAVLGGAFDPITNAHVQLATEICRSSFVDEVWLCPCGPRPDKPTMRTTPQQRYSMAEIAISALVSPAFPVKLTAHEVLQPEPMATYDSLRCLQTAHEDCTFSWVVGSDWLQPGMNLREWESLEGRTGDRLVSEFDFLVLPRPGYIVEDLTAFGPRMQWLKLPHGFTLIESTYSSSEVRKRAQHDWSIDPDNANMLRSVQGLVPMAVIDFMLCHRLYRPLAHPDEPGAV